MNIWKKILGIIYPKTCCFCGKVSDKELCKDCAEKVVYITEPDAKSAVNRFAMLNKNIVMTVRKMCIHMIKEEVSGYTRCRSVCRYISSNIKTDVFTESFMRKRWFESMAD